MNLTKKVFKINLLLIFGFLSCVVLKAQIKIDTLNNKTIIKLTKSKLPESIISSKINESVCNFDISVDALIELKNNLVSDMIINVMIEKQGKINQSVNSTLKNNKNEKNFVFEDTGIYFEKGPNEYVALDATIVSSNRTSAGLINMKLKAQLEGDEANYQITGTPVFYFNFDSNKKSLNNANANASSPGSTKPDNYLESIFSQMGIGGSSNNYQAVSPNDFRLIKLDKSKGRREYISGKVSAFGQFDMSIGGKYLVNFKYDKVSSNTYKIKFDAPLKPGQYAFLYIGNNRSPLNQMYGQNNVKAFDFGIQ